MAKSAAPSTWLSGWTYNGSTTFSITESSLGLTPGDAHATNGDIRKCMLAIMAKLQAFNDGLVTADKLTTFVPTFAANGRNVNATLTITANPASYTVPTLA